jgi:iron complex transport system ATP-binding protein
MSCVLHTENLAIGYLKNKAELVVQSQLNVSLNAGELVCVIGQNGCGKSTLLRTLAGLQNSISGHVYLGDVLLQKMKLHQKARTLALVLTDIVQIENTRVSDLVKMGRQPYSNWWGSLCDEDVRIVDNAIDMVHLTHKANFMLNELSDGERQRAMIAKALAQDTPLVLLDEPTAHLDLPNRVEIMLLLHDLAHRTKKSFLISTHELDIALQAADHIWLMEVGGGIRCGVPEDLVLQGYFNAAFQSKSYYFNTTNGNFSMNYPLLKKVNVQGNKTRMYWTLRALARAGYCVVDNAKLLIDVNETNWLIDNKEFKTIQEVLDFLDVVYVSE